MLMAKTKIATPTKRKNLLVSYIERALTRGDGPPMNHLAP